MKRYTEVYTKLPLLEFDKEYLDIKVNFTGLDKSTKQNPIDIIPSYRIKVLKNIKKLAVNENKKSLARFKISDTSRDTFFMY